jgi:hypothetical protein
MWAGLAAWFGIPLLHGLWMMIDWHLRDPASPGHGGIPDAITEVFAILSLAAFAVLFYHSTRGLREWWLRGLVTIPAVLIAFGLMLLGWLFYGVGNGIDTL